MNIYNIESRNIPTLFLSVKQDYSIIHNFGESNNKTPKKEEPNMKAKDILNLVVVSAVTYTAIEIGITVGSAVCNGVKAGAKTVISAATKKKAEVEEEESEEVFE